jgi:hypothetical protein
MKNTYSATIFKIYFPEEKYYIQDKAKELYEIFDKHEVYSKFDETQIGEYHLYRQLDYRKDGTDFISIDFKSKIYLEDVLDGTEEFSEKRLINIFSGKSPKFSSVLWEEVGEKKIEETKLYLTSRYPKKLKEILAISKTKYLYRDENGYIYFPKFLRKKVFIEYSEALQKEIRNYYTLTPTNRRQIIGREWIKKIKPILEKENIYLKIEGDFKEVEIPTFLIGGNRVVEKIKDYDITNQLKRYGFYKSSGTYNLAILDITGKIEEGFVQNALWEFPVLERYFTQADIRKLNRFELEKKSRDFVKSLEKRGKFLPVIVFEEKGDMYHQIKNAMLQESFPTQFINKKNLEKGQSATLLNIFLQISAKYGDTPYILNKKREVDFYVGFDVSRMKKEEKMLNRSGGVYFFSENGEFLATKKVEMLGEKIRDDEVSKLFSAKKFSGKKIVIHRDGNKPENEVETLRRYFKANDIKAHIVYITKSPSVRVFETTKGVSNPAKGVWLEYSENRAIVVTTNSKVGTKQPLKVEYIALNDEKMDFEKVIKDIFDFTYMSYGSYQDTRLPATVHYSHKISKFLSYGVEPNSEVFQHIYWI